jgi:hypothetical protein
VEPSDCRNKTRTNSETINGLYTWRNKIQWPPEVTLVVSAYATEQQKRPKRSSLDAGDDDGHYNFVSQKYRNRV